MSASTEPTNDHRACPGCDPPLQVCVPKMARRTEGSATGHPFAARVAA
jgi:hypothetical protein